MESLAALRTSSILHTPYEAACDFAYFPFASSSPSTTLSSSSVTKLSAEQNFPLHTPRAFKKFSVESLTLKIMQNLRWYFWLTNLTFTLASVQCSPVSNIMQAISRRRVWSQSGSRSKLGFTGAWGRHCHLGLALAGTLPTSSNAPATCNHRSFTQMHKHWDCAQIL